MRGQTNAGSSRTNRRRFLKGAGAATVAGLAGCSGTQDATTTTSGNDGTDTTTEGTTTGTTSQSVTTLKARFFANAAKEAFIEEHNPKLREQHGIEIEYEMMGWGSAKKQQSTSITSGSGPDVEEIASTWMPKQVKSGGWMDLGDAGVELDQKAVFDAPMEIGNYDGTLAGFPWFWGPRAHLYYDGQFKQAGIDGAPGSWDEMKADAETFNEWAKKQASSGYQRRYLFGVPGANNWAVTQYFMMFLWSNGGQLIDDSGQAVFNTENAVQALNFYKNLAGKHNISPRASVEWNGVARNNAFTSKRIVSTWSGISMAGNIDNAQKALTAGTPPAGPNGEASTFFGVNLMGIHPWTEKTDAAATFIEYLTKPSVNADLAKKRGYLPTVEKAFEAPAIQNNSLFQEFKGVMDQTNAKTAPQVLGYGDLAAALKNAITTILTKEATNSWQDGDTQQALDDAVKQANNALQG